MPVLEARESAADLRHTSGVRSFSIRIERPVDWTAFGVWLSALTYRFGDQILRIKGLLNVPDAHGPVVLNAVQRHVHAPFHLKSWPDEDRASRLVFIVQGLDPDRIRGSLDCLLAWADPPRPIALSPETAIV